MSQNPRFWENSQDLTTLTTDVNSCKQTAKRTNVQQQLPWLVKKSATNINVSVATAKFKRPRYVIKSNNQLLDRQHWSIYFLEKDC